MKKITGFNLIELMITIVIMSLLSMICIPAYSEHIIRANRLQAEIDLIKIASALEKYYLLKNTYENITLNELNMSEIKNQYKFQIVSASRAGFIIQATPLENQAKKDVLCSALSLDNTGEKSITGIGKLTDCWA